MGWRVRAVRLWVCLVEVVRGGSFLATCMHVTRAQLNLDGDPALVANGRVQRLVAVLFGVNDVISLLSADGRVFPVNVCEQPVAFAHVFEDSARPDTVEYV